MGGKLGILDMRHGKGDSSRIPSISLRPRVPISCPFGEIRGRRRSSATHYHMPKNYAHHTSSEERLGRPSRAALRFRKTPQLSERSALRNLPTSIGTTCSISARILPALLYAIPLGSMRLGMPIRISDGARQIHHTSI